MLNIKPEAERLVQRIILHSRYGHVEPSVIASEMPQYSEVHIAFVIEQLSQLPYPDLTRLIKVS